MLTGLAGDCGGGGGDGDDDKRRRMSERDTTKTRALLV